MLVNTQWLWRKPDCCYAIYFHGSRRWNIFFLLSLQLQYGHWKKVKTFFYCRLYWWRYRRKQILDVRCFCEENPCNQLLYTTLQTTFSRYDWVAIRVRFVNIVVAKLGVGRVVIYVICMCVFLQLEDDVWRQLSVEENKDFIFFWWLILLVPSERSWV